MTLRLVGTLDGAPIDLQASLTEQARSLFIKSHTTAHNLSLSSAKKLGLFSDAPVQGNVENFTFDFVGLLRAPKTWAASGDGVVRDLQVAGARTFSIGRRPRFLLMTAWPRFNRSNSRVRERRCKFTEQFNCRSTLMTWGAVRRSLRLLVTILILAPSPPRWKNR